MKEKCILVGPSFPKLCIKLKNNTQEPEYAEFQKQPLIIWQILVLDRKWETFYIFLVWSKFKLILVRRMIRLIMFHRKEPSILLYELQKKKFIADCSSCWVLKAYLICWLFNFFSFHFFLFYFLMFLSSGHLMDCLAS